jgi:excisionase family DNA binding protein
MVNNSLEQPRLISIPEAAHRLPCDVGTLRRMIRAGQFPVVPLRKQLRVDVLKLEKWLDNGGKADGRP